MRFNSLHLMNFGRHADREFEFGPRMNVILGPNGSGKSTLVGALRFLCTGASGLPGTNADRVLTGKDSSRLSLVFEHFSDGGTVTRTLAPKSSAELDYQGVITTGVTAVNNRLMEMLACPLSYVQNYGFVAQKKMDEWFDKTPAERHVEFSRLLGLEKFESVYKDVGRVLASNRLVDDRGLELERKRTELDNLTSSLNHAVAEVSTLEEEIRVLEDSISEDLEILEGSQAALDTWDFLDNLKTFRLERESERKKIWATFRSRPGCPDLESRELVRYVPELEENLEITRDDLVSLKADLRAAQTLVEDKVCPTCGQDTQDSSVAASVHQLNHEIGELTARRAETQGLLDFYREVEKDLKTYREYKDSLEREIKNERKIANSVTIPPMPQITREEANQVLIYCGENQEKLDSLKTRLQVAKSVAVNRREEVKRHTDLVVELETHQEKYRRLLAGHSRLEDVRALLHRDAAPARLLKRKSDALFQSIPSALEAFDVPFSTSPAVEGLGFLCHFPDERGTQSDSQISGGEKIILSWALRLAMDEAVSGGNLGFMGFDEPTAGLDQYNLSRMPVVLDRLRGVAEARDLQILFVTHERSLADMFDTVIDLT